MNDFPATPIKTAAQLSFLVLLPIIQAGSVSAHAHLTDPELPELNDYLMAIQVLRDNNSEAQSLFDQWQHLRDESWKIRALTDDRDLTIDDPDVVAQIERTTRSRESLLKDCRAFLKRQMDVLPAIRLELGESAAISGLESDIRAPVGSRQVVIVEFASVRSGPTHLFLSDSGSEQILFWSKQITVTRSQPRYTFAYVSPLEAGPSESFIKVQEGKNHIGSFRIGAIGTLPASYKWYNHRPADSPTDIWHTPYSPEKVEQIDFEGKSIRFNIRDSKTGDPLPVRVEVRDGDGRWYWAPLRGPSFSVNRKRTGFPTPLWPFQTGPYFYIDGTATLGVEPDGKTVRIYHGFEYEPAVVKVPGDGRVDVTLKRWIDMAERGWYSGQTHIHTTDIGIPVQYTRFWPLVTRGEGLGVSAILTLQGERVDHAIYADEYPMGPLESHSTADYWITYGEEYRNNPYGHLAILGLEHLILPLSSGSLGEAGGPDYPPNQFVLESAGSQGAVTIGAHFGDSITDSEPIKSSWPSTGFEMPVNVALGNMQIAEINGSSSRLDVWYKLLNCGFNLPATAGPDWSIKDTPRAYVYLGGEPFNVENWLDGLKEGRSFVTEGPMLFHTVNGQLPGGQLEFPDGPQDLSVSASAFSPDGPQPVEIVVNGEVVAEGTGLSEIITLHDSAWIAARTSHAHSNPVYVTIKNRPRGFAEEAQEFIAVIDRLEHWVGNKALFADRSQKETVLQVLDKGRAVYENIVERARELGLASPYTPEPNR